MTVLGLQEFLKTPGVILDVRSPGEFTQGRLPGAINLPLFSNEERAAVGTTYKQCGKQQAIELGLKLVGPKLADFAIAARQHVSNGFAKVHCWRGGMRSSSMAWLLGTAGLKTVTLAGGYKAFRRWALEALQQQQPVLILGGLTGSGKTAILHALRDMGEQILDLEALARHRGSSFGMLEMPPQPSTEQFENELAIQWSSFGPNKPIWIEDESRMIGTCKIPDSIFKQMRSAPVLFIERPLEERLDILMQEYGKADLDALISATARLQRRLGSPRTKEAIDLIHSGNLKQAITLLLHYYDKAYQFGLKSRSSQLFYIKDSSLHPSDWTLKLLQAKMTFFN